MKLTEYVSLRMEVVSDSKALTVERGLVLVLFAGHLIGHGNYNKINCNFLGQQNTFIFPITFVNQEKKEYLRSVWQPDRVM